MRQISDPTYLLQAQYKDAGNLNARIELHTRFGTNRYGWLPWIFDQWDTARWPEHCRVLELGCGPGDVWVANQSRIKSTWRMTLSDFSMGMLDQARLNLKAIGAINSMAFEQIDAQHIDHADHTFDVVIANHMLYHVPDRAKALAEIRRVLKPNGTFFATTTGQQHLLELKNIVGEFYAGNGSWGFDDVQFSLESGGAQLMPHFTRIDLRLYEDHLDVTEVEPLVAYIASSVKEAAAEPGPLAEFIYKKLATGQGHIYISKSVGIFCCSGQMERNGT